MGNGPILRGFFNKNPLIDLDNTARPPVAI